MFKQINLPTFVHIAQDSKGKLSALKLNKWEKIIRIADQWRIDDEWWRREPISRMYYKVDLESGRRVVIFRDLLDKKWYKQDY
jgi:hypothetical protein